ncbi:MAG: hypothetical protein J6B13_03330 [Muribaculaceae bacterium]|nr:hypothetical protein [Muribaculaceae bacterium]
MAKNKASRDRKHVMPSPAETPVKADENSQPENINIDETPDDEAPETASMDECSGDKLTFGEKIASIFVPVRQLKKTAALAEERAERATVRIEELENQLEERNQRYSELEKTLHEARLQSDKLSHTMESLGKDLADARQELDEMSRLADNLKAETFAEAAKALPAEMQSRFKSYHDIISVVIAHDEAGNATPRQIVRSLEQVLAQPTPGETDKLLTHFIKLLVAEKLVPSNCTNWRAAISYLNGKNSEIQTLNGRLALAENKLKETASVDHEAEFVGSFEDNNVSDRVGAAIAPWLERRINALIDNEDRRLKAVGDLDTRLSEIAEAVARPGSHDEAVADGVRSVLRPLSEHLGRDVTEVDRLADALSQYFDEKLEHDVIARFTEASREERASLGALVDAANKALADRAKIDTLLRKLATDRIEEIYERAISSHFKDIVAKNKPDEAVEEVMEAFARDNSFDALIRHLVKAVATVERRRDKAQQDADMTQVEVDRLEKQVKDDAEERDRLVKTHNEAVAALDSEHKAELKAQEERRVADLVAQKAELDEAHAAVTRALEEGIASRDADIRGLFDAYLGSVKQSLETIAADVDAAYTGDRSNNSVADVIDHNVIDNDIYGLEEFRANLLGRLDAVGELTADAVRRAVREAFADILKIESATWIDNLARLALYSQVPFIAAEFMASGVRIDRFAAAFAALEAILVQGGITLQLPRLFVDRFNESRHNAEAIKNITSIVSDVASHVPDESTVIDLFTVGYSIDGAEVRKPTVSRLNS